MPTTTRVLTALACMLLLAPGRAADDALVTEVLCAVSADGMTATLSASRGLVLHGWDGAPEGQLELGMASFPRFTDDGRLVFETSVDDGHIVIWRDTWVLDPGTTEPRAPRAGEDLPAWSAPAADAPAADGAPVRLALDAGHGGSDPGAVGNGLLEKDVVLDVILRFADLLAEDTADTSGGGAWDVLLTRDQDVFVSLQARVTMANAFGADSFCSIHANGFGDPQANGTETFAYAEGTTAATLRDAVHARMIEAWGLTDRGTKTAAFYVLVNTTMPAELHELAFITNPGDALVLGDPSKLAEAALAHLFAVQEHHGFGVFDPGPTGGLDGTLKGILHDISLGTGAPIAGGTVSLADGTSTQTSAIGFYEFPLPAGTHAFSATAPGFAVATGSETITSGDAWESLGLSPTNLPGLGTTVNAGQLDLTLEGDVGSPAFLLLATTPQIPLLTLGPDTLWPDLGDLLVVSIGNVPPTGTLSLVAALPSFPGITMHAQGYVASGGSPRLSHGTAFDLP